MTRVALSFDDGPGPSTNEILDALAAAKVPATFFIMGRNLEEAPWGTSAQARALLGRVREEGHVIGNHTYSHERPNAAHRFAQDLQRGEAALRRNGITGPIPFRLPYGLQIVGGGLDPRLSLLASFGKTHVHWTSDFGDWARHGENGQALAQEMVAHVEKQARSGLDAVLDLHDSGTGRSGYHRTATARAVALFVAEAAARHWSFFTVPELG